MPSFWELFPEAQIGIVVVRDMRAASEVPQEDVEAIEALLAQANRQASRHIVDPTLSKNPPVAVWRAAYQRFKTKKGARVSIENLLKRVMKDNPVGHITPSVDIYNAISLKWAMPVGGENLDSFVGDVRLEVTPGGDDFLPLGEGESNDPTLPGELCYLDDAGAICRCWNWRDGVRTALSDDSRNAFLIIESVDPARSEDLAAAIDELAQLHERYLGATVFAKRIVTRDEPEMVIAE